MTAGGPGVFQKSADPYAPRGRLDPDGFDRRIRFRTRAPRDALRPFLDHLWVLRWEALDTPYRSAEVMQRPYVDLFLSRGWSGVQGTFRGKRVYKAEGTGRIVGVRFRPGAFRSFWSGELSTLQDRYLPVSDVLVDLDDVALETLLAQDDDAVMDRLEDLLLARCPVEDDAIARLDAILRAVEGDDGLATVSDVAKVFRCSERTLQHLFRTYVGIGLKWFLQRRRLLAAAERVRALETPDWADIAYELGYSSQQHFITDFRTVTGETPVQYGAALRRSRAPDQAG